MSLPIVGKRARRFWGFMRRVKEEERLQISYEIMTFEAESLEGQVRASVFKSPG